MNVLVRGLAGACLSLAVVSTAVAVRAGAPGGRYTISNGTVYDTKTRLTWRQAVPTTQYTYSNAVSYCPTTFGAGWRLPTYKELFTIVDTNATTSPIIDVTAFPSTPRGNFWSIATAAGSTGSSWFVSFSTFGGTSSVPTSSGDMFYVRCVK